MYVKYYNVNIFNSNCSLLLIGRLTKMNRDEHLFGAFVFSLFYWFLATNNSLTGLLVTCIFACIGGLMPDVLEPATWPGHRGFFHYFFGPFCIVPALLFMNSSNLGFMGGAFCFGYFSHFLLDVI